VSLLLNDGLEMKYTIIQATSFWFPVFDWIAKINHIVGASRTIHIFTMIGQTFVMPYLSNNSLQTQQFVRNM
jgi:hypothetical protein